MRRSAATQTPPTSIQRNWTSAMITGAFLVAEARFQTPSEQMISVHRTRGQCRLSSFFSVTPSDMSLHHRAGCERRRGDHRDRSGVLALHLEVGRDDLC